ncbi:hypothetical protein SLS57_010558 [Botryosphaeria dothidea]
MYDIDSVGKKIYGYFVLNLREAAPNDQLGNALRSSTSRPALQPLVAMGESKVPRQDKKEVLAQEAAKRILNDIRGKGQSQLSGEIADKGALKNYSPPETVGDAKDDGARKVSNFKKGAVTEGAHTKVYREATASRKNHAASASTGTQALPTRAKNPRRVDVLPEQKKSPLSRLEQAFDNLSASNTDAQVSQSVLTTESIATTPLTRTIDSKDRRGRSMVLHGHGRRSKGTNTPESDTSSGLQDMISAPQSISSARRQEVPLTKHLEARENFTESSSNEMTGKSNSNTSMPVGEALVGNLKEQNLNFVDIINNVGSSWQKLSPEERQAFEQQASNTSKAMQETADAAAAELDTGNVSDTAKKEIVDRLMGSFYRLFGNKLQESSDCLTGIGSSWGSSQSVCTSIDLEPSEGNDGSRRGQTTQRRDGSHQLFPQSGRAAQSRKRNGRSSQEGDSDFEEDEGDGKRRKPSSGKPDAVDEPPDEQELDAEQEKQLKSKKLARDASEETKWASIYLDFEMYEQYQRERLPQIVRQELERTVERGPQLDRLTEILESHLPETVRLALTRVSEEYRINKTGSSSSEAGSQSRHTRSISDAQTSASRMDGLRPGEPWTHATLADHAGGFSSGWVEPFNFLTVPPSDIAYSSLDDTHTMNSASTSEWYLPMHNDDSTYASGSMPQNRVRGTQTPLENSISPVYPRFDPTWQQQAPYSQRNIGGASITDSAQGRWNVNRTQATYLNERDYRGAGDQFDLPDAYNSSYRTRFPGL